MYISCSYHVNLVCIVLYTVQYYVCTSHVCTCTLSVDIMYKPCMAVQENIQMLCDKNSEGKDYQRHLK